MKTKAAILVSQKKDLVVDEVEIPSLDFGKVLVEIRSTRICGSQLGEISGAKGPDQYLPHLLGHEAGGIVREVGNGVSRVKESDHVVCHWRPASGIAGACPTYKWGNKKVNSGHITTFSEFSILSENRLTKIDKKFSFDVAALMADTITTGFGIISNDAKVKIGEGVCVIGVGGIGLGVLLGAKLAGANPIIAVDLHDHKLSKSIESGATHTINSSKQNLIQEIQEIVGPEGVDVMIDGTGNPKVIETAYDLTKKQGRCVLFGVIPFDRKVELNTLPLHLGKKLTGSEGGQSKPDLDIPNYLKMLDQGLYDLDGFISHREKLENINEAIGKMIAGKSIHSIIDFSL